MSEEDLELLITLDDPVDAQEEDTFNHQSENTLEFWLGQPSPEGKSKGSVIRGELGFSRTSGGSQ